MSNTKEFAELVKILSQPHIGGISMEFSLLVIRMYEKFECDGKLGKPETFKAVLEKFKSHPESVTTYYIQMVREICGESNRILSQDDIDGLNKLGDEFLDTDWDTVSIFLEERFPGPWDSHWRIQQNKTRKVIQQNLESLRSRKRRKSKISKVKSHAGESKYGSEHIVRRYMDNIEHVSPKRFPYSFVEDLSGYLISDFMDRHSISVVGWKNFLEEKIDPFFAAIVDSLSSPSESRTQAEWDLYRIHLMTDDAGLAALVKVAEFSGMRLDLENLTKPSRKVAMINYYLQSRKIFEEAWVLRFLRSIPEEEWTRGIEYKQKNTCVHKELGVALGQKISSFMSEQLGRLHNCRVEVLLDYFVGTYWIVYPYEYREEFIEEYEGREVKVIRPVYEIVFFMPDQASSVDFYYRGLSIDRDVLINIWMEAYCGRRVDSLAKATVVNGIRLAEDGSGIWIKSEFYKTTTNQFRVIEFYLNKKLSGAKSIYHKHALNELNIGKTERSDRKIREVFKNNIDLYNLIFEHDSRGNYWLRNFS